MTHKDKEILCDSLPFYSETVTPHVRLQTGVSPVWGFLFMLWCQGTGQRRRKQRWQNSADPAKPQNCSSCPLAWLTLQTVWLSRQLQTRLWDVNCYKSSSCFGSFWADHGRTVGLEWVLSVLWGQCVGKMEPSEERGSVCSWRMFDRKCQRHIWNSYTFRKSMRDSRGHQHAACPPSSGQLCGGISLQQLERGALVGMCAVPDFIGCVK